MGRPRLFLLTTFVFLPHLPFTTFGSLPYLPFRLLLIRSPICLFDYFYFAPFIRRNFFPSGLLHSFSSNHSLSTNHSFFTNLRLRIFHALVPHNLVYPELFFVPMSISTAEQIPTQSTIPQLVTHIIRQTERCSSPCFFMGVSIMGY